MYRFSFVEICEYTHWHWLQKPRVNDAAAFINESVFYPYSLLLFWNPVRAQAEHHFFHAQKQSFCFSSRKKTVSSSQNSGVLIVASCCGQSCGDQAFPLWNLRKQRPLHAEPSLLCSRKYKVFLKLVLVPPPQKCREDTLWHCAFSVAASAHCKIT